MGKEAKKGKGIGRLIIAALMTGKPLTSAEIADMIFKSDGLKIKVQNISSLLSKISKKDDYELGHFIKKEKGNNCFIYQIVEDAMKLSEDKAYDLILKSGEKRYTLEQALNEFPELRKYVETHGKTKVTPETKVAQKSKKSKPAAKKAVVLPPKIKAPAKTAEEKKSESSDFSEFPGGEDFPDKLAAAIIRKINELGGLNLNVKLSLKPDEKK